MTDREMLKRAYLFLFYCLLFGILPLSGTANNNVSGSFYNLLNQYNATSGTTGATNIVQLPLAFVRSDAVNLRDGKIWYLGQYGAYWSRTAQSSNYAYY